MNDNTCMVAEPTPPQRSALQIIPIPAFRDNYIWALCGDARCVVVDPGDAAPVMDFLSTRGLQLDAVLITHRHHDHVDGVPELTTVHPVPVYGPASIACVTHPVQPGTLHLAALPVPLDVMFLPGHTEEHIAYLMGNALFCGDTLFSAGCGRLLGGTAAQLHASLQRIAALPGNTVVYCTHEYTLTNLRFAMQIEPDNSDVQRHLQHCLQLRADNRPTLPTTIALERTINPFLRCTQPAVIASAGRLAGTKLSDSQAVFSALREARNHFTG